MSQAGPEVLPVAWLAALAGPALLLALLAVVLTRALLARAFRQRLGGYTGDCMGAAQQISETLWYLAVCAVLYAGAPGLN